MEGSLAAVAEGPSRRQPDSKDLLDMVDLRRPEDADGNAGAVSVERFLPQREHGRSHHICSHIQSLAVEPARRACRISGDACS